MTAPRCRWPSVVILTSSPNTNSASSAISCVFTTRALLSANVWSHWRGSHISFLLGQKAYTSCDQFYNSLIGPPPAESPASHTCLTSGIRVLRLWIKMDMFIAYHGIARGSPCVVPSWDKISSPPPVNNLEGLLYMLMIYMAISGQKNLDVAGVNQQDSVCTINIGNLGHGVYGGLDTSTVTSANLQGAGCQLDLLLKCPVYKKGG